MAETVGSGDKTACREVERPSIVSSSTAIGSGTATIDWSKGNTQYTTDSCQAFTFNNVIDGGNYTFVVKGGTSATITFNSTGLTYHITPTNSPTTALTHTIYTFFRAGSDVCVTWVKGL